MLCFSSVYINGMITINLVTQNGLEHKLMTGNDAAMTWNSINRYWRTDRKIQNEMNHEVITTHKYL